MPNLPTGTITFLFTDIEGSTKRWEANPAAMKAAFSRHEAIVRHAIEANRGYAYKMIGDAFQAAFPTAPQALQAALDAQHSLQSENWPAETGEVRVRMALHTGTTEERENDYVGPALNPAARLLAAGHGGQILLSDVTYGLVRDDLPSGVQLLDMGEHRLKDLIRREHIFQLAVPDLPSQFPPLKTLDNHPNNLPLQPTLFVGREKGLAEVDNLLGRERAEVRLLTLTGPGGTGKTRLSLQVASSLLEEFSDGVWFVELASLVEHKLVLPTIAAALGVKEAAGQPLIDTLKAYLKEKHLLLVLDNFEQVVEAAPQVSQLLASCERLKVLVTSRVPLMIRSERVYSVPPLEVPDIHDLHHLPPLERLTQYEAVRLFIERAADVKPGFKVTNENAPAVAQICVQLDGLPLAIELAAARVRTLSPDALLARLSESLSVLTGGARDLPERQRTLRNTIDWSYNLLEEGEKTLFRRMAPFSGGRSPEAVEEVCNYDGRLSALGIDVFEGVSSLLSKNLMREVEAGGGEPRFWMLETIHEYAREKLAEGNESNRGEADALYRQHALYFMRLAEEAEPHLTGAKQSEWLQRLEDEHDNLRAALRWVGEREEFGDKEAAREAREVGLRLAGALSRFWYVRGYLSEGREELGEMLQVGRGLGSPADSGPRPPAPGPSFRAKALNGVGNLAYSQGDYATARSLHEESLAISRQLGDKRGIANSLNNLANVAYSQGDYAAARSLYEESLAIRRELGDEWGIAVSLSNLGLVAYGQEDYATARSLHEGSLAISRQLGDKRGISYSLHNLGTVAYSQGDYATARSLHEESLAIRRELGDKRGISYSLNSMGTVAYLQGDYAAARSLYEESLAIRRDLGDKRGCAECLAGLGGVAVRMGQAQAQTRAEGQAQRGARLLGAAEALLGAISAVLDPEDRMVYEQGVASARAQLSEEEFERARAEGRTMSLERAMEYALEES